MAVAAPPGLEKLLSGPARPEGSLLDPEARDDRVRGRGAHIHAETRAAAQGEHAAAPSGEEGAGNTLPPEQPRHAIERVAFADSPEVQGHARQPETHRPTLRIQLDLVEPHQSQGPRDIL